MHYPENNYKSLYSSSGDIKDINTMLVSCNELKAYAKKVVELNKEPKAQHFSLNPDRLALLLKHSMKPEEISGSEGVQHSRVAEILSWMARYVQGQANPKWLAEHACELAYYIASNGVNREIDLKEIRDKSFTEGVNTSESDRALLNRISPEKYVGSFQKRVKAWMLACFGETISADKSERNFRFLEEALELVQATGCTAEEAHRLVDYVYDRPVGEPFQEVGGVMVTLAALCQANKLDMHDAGEVELQRILSAEIMAKIRAKQASKPIRSPLPE